MMMSLPAHSSSINSDESSQQSEADNSVTAGGTAHDMNTRHVSINDLPDEILIEILSHMSFTELTDVTQKVCSRWKRLSQDSQLWTDKKYILGDQWYLDPDHFSDTCKDDDTDEEALQTLCNTPNLRKIRFHRVVSPLIIRMVHTVCHQLTELHLDFDQDVTYSELKNLVEKCTKIHTLSIPVKLLESEKFAEAVSQLQHLRVLKLGGCHRKNILLRTLCDGCSQLAEVDFSYFDINMDDLKPFLNANRNTLKSLCIKWIMGGRCIVPLLTVCADSLEYLTLYPNVNDHPNVEASETFASLGCLKNLVELKAEITVPLHAAYLAFKSGGLSKLKLLAIAHLDNDTLNAIFCNCPALRNLRIRTSDAELLSDTAFSQIHRLKDLEMLDVSRCRGLSGALIPYLTGLPQLHTLTTSDFNFRDSESGVSSILDLTGLCCLRLSRSAVAGIPFDKFPEKLINLRKLFVDWCRGDSKAIDMLRKEMSGLYIYGSIGEDKPRPRWP